MKYILLFTCLIPCLAFNKAHFIDITDDFTIDRFEAVKNFILKHGNTQTYRNFDNNNPHYKIDNTDIYLNAETGQKNMNNNPDLSDFNEITIHSSSGRYYTIRIVRVGDHRKRNISIPGKMKENRVYLINDYGSVSAAIKKDVLNYLLKIEAKLSVH
ncbi:hypothetical protein SAMN05421820_11614 [Pedobacter steynii]|uniref:Uncharacterized protein n=1 Tax=Pedobacter steynii TaxID=430522 RepID=A0A1H0KCJ8_9SPHI|nr:hypothetical protein [Pedobacter steynii]NQX43254.1 hypothetical protein [Pedobacter steynii]SDO53510.1 hypothetical protein SAMN05421820_11614 [Pedobacter steynii]